LELPYWSLTTFKEGLDGFQFNHFNLLGWIIPGALFQGFKEGIESLTPVGRFYRNQGFPPFSGRLSGKTELAVKVIQKGTKASLFSVSPQTFLSQFPEPLLKPFQNAKKRSLF